MPKHPDTDYLYLSAHLKARERNFFTPQQLQRLILARDEEEVGKLLSEHGWQPIAPGSMDALEKEISRQRRAAFDLLYRYAPDPAIIDLFRLKYDIHNLKVLTKATVQGLDATELLSGAGIYPPKKLTEIFLEKQYYQLSPGLSAGLQEAIELLSRTGDPQLSDLRLDAAKAAEMLRLATESESEFLLGYVRLSIDADNLRVLTRVSLAGKGFDYLRRAIFPGGNTLVQLPPEINAEWVLGLFGHGFLANAAAAAAAALTGKATGKELLARLDLACDNALVEYLKTAKLIPFGEAPVISYLLTVEAQLVAIRTIVGGRLAGLSAEHITERLRQSYV